MLNFILTKWKLNKAAIQFQKNNFDSAKLIYEEILESQPKNIDALLWLGSIYSEKEEYPKAFELLESVIAINPNRYESYVNLGLLKAKLNRDQEAIVTWKDALTITKMPKSVKAELYYNIGRTLIELKEYGKSMEYANKALNLKPNYYEAKEIKIHAYQMLSNN